MCVCNPSLSSDPLCRHPRLTPLWATFYSTITTTCPPSPPASSLSPHARVMSCGPPQRRHPPPYSRCAPFSRCGTLGWSSITATTTPTMLGYRGRVCMCVCVRVCLSVLVVCVCPRVLCACPYLVCVYGVLSARGVMCRLSVVLCVTSLTPQAPLPLAPSVKRRDSPRPVCYGVTAFIHRSASAPIRRARRRPLLLP